MNYALSKLNYILSEVREAQKECLNNDDIESYNAIQSSKVESLIMAINLINHNAKLIQQALDYQKYMCEVEKIVTNVYEITPYQLMGSGKTNRSVWARNVCVEIRRKHLEKFKTIADRYGRTHGAMVNNLKTHFNDIENGNEKYCNLYNQAMEKINLIKYANQIK